MSLDFFDFGWKKIREKKLLYFICKFFLFLLSHCRKRFRVNSEDDVNLVHREHPIGKQTKSVQVHIKFLFVCYFFF